MGAADLEEEGIDNRYVMQEVRNKISVLSYILTTCLFARWQTSEEKEERDSLNKN